MKETRVEKNGGIRTIQLAILIAVGIFGALFIALPTLKTRYDEVALQTKLADPQCNGQGDMTLFAPPKTWENESARIFWDNMFRDVMAPRGMKLVQKDGGNWVEVTMPYCGCVSYQWKHDMNSEWDVGDRTARFDNMTAVDVQHRFKEAGWGMDANVWFQSPYNHNEPVHLQFWKPNERNQCVR